MTYIVKFQRLGSEIVKEKEFTGSISTLIQVLGKYGYHVISYHQKTSDELLFVNL